MLQLTIIFITDESVNYFLTQWISCLVYNMSHNGEKCLSWFPRDHVVFKCLVLFNQPITVIEDKKKTANIDSDFHCRLICWFFSWSIHSWIKKIIATNSPKPKEIQFTMISDGENPHNWRSCKRRTGIGSSIKCLLVSALQQCDCIYSVCLSAKNEKMNLSARAN